MELVFEGKTKEPESYAVIYWYVQLLLHIKVTPFVKEEEG